MKLLVTGGSGFIGSAVVRHALAEGHKVINIDAETYAASPLTTADFRQNARYLHLRLNINDNAAMDRVFAHHQPDRVIHLAAESHVDRSIDGPSRFVETNIMGTFSLLEAARHYWDTSGCPESFRFLHVSTDEVFGSLGQDGTFDENSAYAPSSPYSASKAASDHLVRAWAKTYGLPVLISNCSNNFGPFQFPEKFVPVVILAALNGHPIPVYGNGMNVRDWLFVDDHAQALLTILDKGRIGETYAVGAANECSNLEMVEHICAAVDELGARSGSHELITYVADRPGHDHRYAIDASKLREELGWTPTLTLREGIEQTVSWYMAHPEWWLPMLANDPNERDVA